MPVLWERGAWVRGFVWRVNGRVVLGLEVVRGGPQKVEVGDMAFIVCRFG